ncbi:MAG: alginate lyase family protein [bacterium]
MNKKLPYLLLVVVQLFACSSEAKFSEKAESTQLPAIQKIHANGIWLSKRELAVLPTTGRAWKNLKAVADKLHLAQAKGGHGSVHDTQVMAAALVAARLNDQKRLQEVAEHIIKAVDNKVESDGNSLSLSRTVTGYILAADLIDLKSLDAEKDQKFRKWLEYVVYKKRLDKKTQIQKHEIRGNNHGTQAGVVRIAAALYLGKLDDLNRAAAVFKGWLGDRKSYSGFKWGDLCWQADPKNPVGILPKGTKMRVVGDMRDVDGVQPDDQRRAGCPDSEISWPPRTDVHVWGGLQGAVGQAYLLSRAGFDSWSWGDQAILRAVSWQQDPQRGNAPAKGDDRWILPLIDRVYGTNFWNGKPVKFGKQVGWTDWTHGTKALN